MKRVKLRSNLYTGKRWLEGSERKERTTETKGLFTRFPLHNTFPHRLRKHCMLNTNVLRRIYYI